MQVYLTLQLAKIPDRYPFSFFFLALKKKPNYFSEIHLLIVFEILFEKCLHCIFMGKALL